MCAEVVAQWMMRFLHKYEDREFRPPEPTQKSYMTPKSTTDRLTDKNL